MSEDKDNINKEEKPESKDKKSQLSDFQININTFGELQTNYSIDKINEFLNKEVEDKKLKNRKKTDQSED